MPRNQMVKPQSDVFEISVHQTNNIPTQKKLANSAVRQVSTGRNQNSISNYNQQASHKRLDSDKDTSRTKKLDPSNSRHEIYKSDRQRLAKQASKAELEVPMNSNIAQTSFVRPNTNGGVGERLEAGRIDRLNSSNSQEASRKSQKKGSKKLKGQNSHSPELPQSNLQTVDNDSSPSTSFDHENPQASFDQGDFVADHHSPGERAPIRPHPINDNHELAHPHQNQVTVDDEGTHQIDGDSHNVHSDVHHLEPSRHDPIDYVGHDEHRYEGVEHPLPRQHEYGTDHQGYHIQPEQEKPYGQVISSTNGKHSPTIRVVFNNNPQFIIGSSSGGSRRSAKDHLSDVRAQHRYRRQPKASLYEDGELYRPDESALDETKLSSEQRDVASKLPCDEEKHRPKLNDSNMEQIDLSQPPVSVQQLSKDNDIVDLQTQVVDRPIPKSSPPPQINKETPQISTTRLEDGDRRSKSLINDLTSADKVRPPLRMLISLINNDGHMMQVPINLHGKNNSANPDTTRSSQGSKIDRDTTNPLKQQSKQTSKEELASKDNSTPADGDIFDANLTKPFQTRSQHEETGDSRPGSQSKKRVDCDHRDHKKDEDHKLDQSEKSEKGNTIPGGKTQRHDFHPQLPHAIMPLQMLGHHEQSDGVVHLMMPKVTPVHNKTFADMFVKFQTALNEQMNNHFLREEKKDQSLLETAKELSRKEESDREDVMVAMMAANMTGSTNDPKQEHLNGFTMTVIKPPKGVTVQQAIKSHQLGEHDGQTMAILQEQSSMSEKDKPNRFETTRAPDIRVGTKIPTIASADDDNGAVPVAFDVNLRPNPDFSNTGSNSPTNQGEPSPMNGGGAVDPDGFSASSSEHTSEENEGDHLQLASSIDDLPIEWRELIRRSVSDARSSHPNRLFKRSATLEPEDKLPIGRRRPLPSRKQIITTRRPKQTSGSVKKPQVVNKRAGHKFNGGLKKDIPRFQSKVNPKSNKDMFLASASQNEQISADEESDDEDSDESDSSPSSSDSNSSSSSDEPSALASGDGSVSGDENDYTNGSDDFDDTSGFDSDDEPFNQVASSERNSDYNSFEIPQIDINPSTLQQKGCKTVLREVQEIPMNGLGVVQANGRPGSGYLPSAAASNQIGGLRVKRSYGNNDNLINSRKVTSIVMTKECHFPNDQSQPAQRGQKMRNMNTENRSAPKPVQKSATKGRSQFGDQSVASEVKPRSLAVQKVPVPIVMGKQNAIRRGTVQAIPQPPHPQQQQQRPQQIGPSFYLQHPTMGFYSSGVPYKASGTNQGTYLRSVSPRQVETNYDRSGPRSRYVPESGRLANVALMEQPSTIKRRSVGPQPNPVMARAVQAPSASTYMNLSSVRVAPSTRFNWQRPHAGTDQLGAASGVVARKLYKPPSEDDPYHTLSYSSKTGIDPDMEQDDDDSVVMGSESDDAPRSASSRSNPTRSHRNNALSAQERAALADPNYDDTDPGENERAYNHARPPYLRQQKRQQQMRPQPPRSRANQFDDRANDADEIDGDLSEESTSQRRALPNLNGPRNLISRPNHNQHGEKIEPEYERRSYDSGARRGGASNHPDQTASMGRRPAARTTLKPRIPLGAKTPGDNRFGRSFKFEHEISRRSDLLPRHPTQGNLAGATMGKHLSSLPAGKLIGFVSVRGDGSGQESKRLTGNKPDGQSFRRNVMEASRRQDDGDDDDDDDDDEADDSRGSGSRSGRGNQMAASNPSPGDVDADSSSDPDADPEYNPKETRLPAHTKPKRFEKSFAYVHRDLPKKGSPNPDDFVVSYGRGNVQSEHEDYDSDKDNPPQEDRKRRSPGINSGRQK